MIQRDDILSMEYLKKTEFTGCHQGMRYRLEQTQAPEDPEGGKKLMYGRSPLIILRPRRKKREEHIFLLTRMAWWMPSAG